MPLGDGVKAYLYGSATGIWNVNWITFWGVMLFNTLVMTGVFDKFQVDLGNLVQANSETLVVVTQIKPI
jgi:L-lactate permease